MAENLKLMDEDGKELEIILEVEIKIDVSAKSKMNSLQRASVKQLDESVSLSRKNTLSRMDSDAESNTLMFSSSLNRFDV